MSTNFDPNLLKIIITPPSPSPAPVSPSGTHGTQGPHGPSSPSIKPPDHTVTGIVTGALSHKEPEGGGHELLKGVAKKIQQAPTSEEEVQLPTTTKKEVSDPFEWLKNEKPDKDAIKDFFSKNPNLVEDIVTQYLTLHSSTRENASDLHRSIIQAYAEGVSEKGEVDAWLNKAISDALRGDFILKSNKSLSNQFQQQFPEYKTIRQKIQDLESMLFILSNNDLILENSQSIIKHSLFPSLVKWREKYDENNRQKPDENTGA